MVTAGNIPHTRATGIKGGPARPGLYTTHTPPHHLDENDTY